MQRLKLKIKELWNSFDTLGKFGFMIAFLSIFSPPLIYIIYIKFDFPGEVASAGPIGDFIAGTMVPLLTFASTLILISTLKIQRKDINDQKKDILTQAETMELQRFENTFFELLNTNNKIIDSLSVKISPNTYHGYQAFFYILSSIQNRTRTCVYRSPNKPSDEITMREYNRQQFNLLSKEKKLEYYRYTVLEIQNFYKSHGNKFTHYLRFLYRTIKFIDEYKFKSSENEKKVLEYMDIIRAPLSEDQLGLLYYNLFTLPGLNFIKYIEVYNLFDNLEYNELQSNPAIYGLYEILLQNHKHIVSEMKYIEKNLPNIKTSPEEYSDALMGIIEKYIA
ncbi:hypothetical protein CN975_03560 [Bacillus cereus]|uniref:putative phage abortive infection protein n=1 Tax=Bacillus cereus TaxID=1396 RepID=UPI000BFCF28B|nr:putative phage abortive infection protein [Bacillus cereus]PGN97326.1 hypothetical protein CN975_03560 [Bacillus cereus]